MEGPVQFQDFVETEPRAAKVLQGLAQAPPQSLLLEASDRMGRLKGALYWTALLNCPDQGEDGPCGTCDLCRALADLSLRDLLLFDGGEGSIKIDHVRGVRALMGQAPAGEGSRVVVLAEAQALTTEAANSLLKSLEEPRPGNCFVLLAPQRERLLETLVSRSWVLTLAWPREAHDPEAEELARAMVDYWRTGRGWFARTLPKGAVNRALAQRTLARLEAHLAAALAGGPGRDSGLAAVFDVSRLRRLDTALATARDSLDLGPASFANPALVLDWLAANME